jgi:hypothetical protein
MADTRAQFAANGFDDPHAGFGNNHGWVSGVVMTQKTPGNDDNLAVEIARLARLGLDPAQIAERLGIPVERVGASQSGVTDSAPGDLGGRDETAADSFPASDPPPGPGA